MFWFHCGRCGSLFQSHAGDVEHRLCPECGADPSLGILESPVAAAHPGEETTPDSTAKSDHPAHGGKRSGKKRKNRHFMLQLVGGWSLVLALIILGASKLWHEKKPERKQTASTAAAATITDEDAGLLNSAGPKCAEIFSGYLAAGTPEARNQFVLTPIATASRMARFYALNPLANVDPETLSRVGESVLKLPGSQAIETYWKTSDGKKLDAVFREQNGEWRLDWDHFARYGDYPWTLFLSGGGNPEGEFRLLARERLAEQRKGSDTISVMLYAPRFGQPGQAGFQSPEFLVSRSSRDGQLLDAAFKLARRGERVFGAKLPDLNPEDMIRVRVKVRRSEVDMERKFEITGVLACHWYSVDDPGVEPSVPAAEQAQDR
jgi:hypothetical protein